MNDRRSLIHRFRALHDGPEPLLLPNPWDAGTARLLEALGFQALGTTSLGAAISSGRRRLDRDAILANCRTICEATTLPVTADLENGFADDPEEAARCVTLAAEVGAAGASIEDSTGDPDHPVYDFDHAVERVAAAVETAHAGSDPMVLTARAESLLFNPDDVDGAVRRLQAFEAAGADVLYAPYIRDLRTMKTVVESVSSPVNVVMGFADPSITLADLRAIGVRRISIGGGLNRLAMATFLRGARSMLSGDFRFVDELASIDELMPVMK